MEHVQRLELSSNPSASSSYFPLSLPIPPEEGLTGERSITRERFIALPCHYFDYVAGSGTGG